MHGIIGNILLLGVASTLRRVKSKRPRLQRLYCKAGALLLARRSLETTPSVGMGIPVPCRDGARPVSTLQPAEIRPRAVYFFHFIRV
jgi:hypothetical protein